MKLTADLHQEEIDENRQKVQKVPGKSLPGPPIGMRKKCSGVWGIVWGTAPGKRKRGWNLFLTP